MEQKKASDLQVGEIFCRDVHEPTNPRRDSLYTVQKVQFIPLRDFYGHYVNTVQVTAENHLLGPASLTLSSDELVWVLDPSFRPEPPPAAPGEGSGRDRSGRRFRFSVGRRRGGT